MFFIQSWTAHGWGAQCLVSSDMLFLRDFWETACVTEEQRNRAWLPRVSGMSLWGCRSWVLGWGEPARAELKTVVSVRVPHRWYCSAGWLWPGPRLWIILGGVGSQHLHIMFGDRAQSQMPWPALVTWP